MKMSNEVKTGLLVVVAVLVAVFFFTKTANFQTGTYEIKTYFTHAGDLKTDAVVKLAGIEAGRLKEVKFVYGEETKVECVLALNPDAKVRDNAVAYIGTAGFVGDAYIGLTPGTSPTFLKDGDSVASEEPVQMRILMKQAEKIMDGIKDIVTDNKENVDNIVLNLEATTQNFKEFSEDVKKHPWKIMFKGD